MPTYDVTIASSSFSGNTAPDDGFIDPTRPFNVLPDSLENSLQKMRAYERYLSIIDAMRHFAKARLISETVNGGSHNTDPTNVVLRFFVPMAPAIEDENNPGVFLNNEAALERIVARVLIRSYTKRVEVYDPTDLTIVRNGANQTIDRGLYFDTETIGAVAADLSAAEAAITVAEV